VTVGEARALRVELVVEVRRVGCAVAVVHVQRGEEEGVVVPALERVRERVEPVRAGDQLVDDERVARVAVGEQCPELRRDREARVELAQRGRRRHDRRLERSDAEHLWRAPLAWPHRPRPAPAP
jgi:hypothetical protein